jgi:type I restriction-modification system DNA methylase subunit
MSCPKPTTALRTPCSPNCSRPELHPDGYRGDAFGKIYEYFLGKFAMSRGQKGGEFFTPTSIVR